MKCLTTRDSQSEVGQELKRIRTTYDGLQVNLSKDISSIQQQLQDSIQDARKSVSNVVNASAAESANKSLAAITQKLQLFQSTTVMISIQDRILRQLVFPGMRARQHQISDTGDNTFNWLFHGGSHTSTDSWWDDERNQLRQKAQKDLLVWLSHGQGIFHISGKPGSGKSTFMKYLISHSKTQEALRQWAGPRTLAVATHYFWNSGTLLQRTLSGLFKSLLFGVLSSCPELMRIAFPRQWEQLRTSPTRDFVLETTAFDDPEVESEFYHLSNNLPKEQYRYCFFIDGLDECQGNRLEHEALAKRLTQLSATCGIKICASSRPYQEYLDVFGNSQNITLHLHLINEPDIMTYCRQRFTRDREVQATHQNFNNIINEVVKQSQGVFLWAHLVVNILLMGIRQGDSQDVLMQKLEETPEELNDLYDKLRSSSAKSDIDKKQADRMLLFTLQNPFLESLNTLTYSWLQSPHELQNPDFPDVELMARYSIDEIEARVDIVRKQINTLTRGFLDLSPLESSSLLSVGLYGSFDGAPGCIQFSHRTAMDYFRQNPERLALLKESFPELESSDGYGRTRAAEYCALMLPQSASHVPHLWYQRPFLLPGRVNEVSLQKTFTKFQILFQNCGPLALFKPCLGSSGYSVIYTSQSAAFVNFAVFYGLNDYIPFQ